MWAIIGGSGYEQFSEFTAWQELDPLTPYGFASSGAKQVLLNRQPLVLLPRHGQYHECPPGEVNYRANIYLLKKLGVTKILALSAVGSLRKELKPGDLVVPTQYIDHTKGLRAHTFSAKGMVGHVSLAEPVSLGLVNALAQIADQLSFPLHVGYCYICIEGPAFSTKAETSSYRAMGADIIGMTNFPEYALAREAGICYLPCCFVSDYDCWYKKVMPVTVEEMLKVMGVNRLHGFELIKKFIPLAQSLFPNGCPELSLNSALLSNRQALTAEQQALLALFAAD